MPRRSRLSPAAAFLGLLLITPAEAQGKRPALDEALIKADAATLYASVAQAVQDAGGDLERQHVHLAFAFSTGHFARDPLMAEAARAVATRVAAEHLVQGDQVSAYAWEMNVWPHKGASLNPFAVPADRASLGTALQDLWPRSPQAGSAGGHDTEQAITTLGNTLGGAKNAVLVLLTNSAASVAGTKEQRTIGENAAPYKAALGQWTRVRTSSTSGASTQLVFDRGGGGERTLDAVVVVPKAFGGAALPVARSTLLEQQTGNRGGNLALPWWAWVAGAAVLLGLALLILRGLRNRAPRNATESMPAVRAPTPGKRTPQGWQLRVGSQSFPLSAVGAGDTVCTVCGPNYPVGAGAAQYVLLTDPNLPPQRLVTVTLERGGLKLTPEGGAALSGEALSGDVPQGDGAGVLPLRDEEYRVRVSGRASRQNLPPRPYQADLRFTLARTE